MKLWLSAVVGAYLVACVFSECKFIDKKSATESVAETRLRAIADKVKRVQFLEVSTSYQYTIGICEKARVDLTEAKFEKAGVVQQNITDHQTPYLLGRIDSASVVAGKDWVFLEYFKGDKYHTSCNGTERAARIMFTCAPDATTPRARAIEEMKDKFKGCYYLFEVETEAACTPKAPESHKLSVGSVLCIIFMVVVAIYLIGGAIYQRLVVGAKGMEQIPNYSFWQDFGNLQADGCDFLCRSGGKTRGSREYRGIGDDQIHPSHEELSHDDTLLTM